MKVRVVVSVSAIVAICVGIMHWSGSAAMMSFIGGLIGGSLGVLLVRAVKRRVP